MVVWDAGSSDDVASVVVSVELGVSEDVNVMSSVVLKESDVLVDISPLEESLVTDDSVLLSCWVLLSESLVLDG